LGIINPIYNEQSCWENDCHAHEPNQKVLGVLDITMSLAEVDRNIRAGQMRLFGFVIIAIASISLMIYWLVNRMVLKPVNQVVEATQHVAAGDLNYIITLNKNDEIGALAKSFNDMTHKLSEAQRQLYQSDKLASVGRLAAGVAHEINNPLTGVLTYSSFLLKRANDKPEFKEDLEVIVRETKRCRDIVKGLLDFARQSQPTKRQAQADEIISHAVRIVQNQLSIHHINLEQNLHPHLPLVNVDVNQIQQVLVNLLVNANDAIGEKGGTITITTELVNPDMRMAIDPLPAQKYIQIKVRDTGCGIPAENLPKIFDPFFTTKGQKGTGLGLAVVWGIIEKHNGRITVESEIGKGTTFRIFLPVDEGS
jgi:two-component system NtrC family sensor kinase